MIAYEGMIAYAAMIAYAGIIAQRPAGPKVANADFSRRISWCQPGAKKWIASTAQPTLGIHPINCSKNLPSLIVGRSGRPL